MAALDFAHRTQLVHPLTNHIRFIFHQSLLPFIESPMSILIGDSINSNNADGEGVGRASPFMGRRQAREEGASTTSHAADEMSAGQRYCRRKRTAWRHREAPFERRQMPAA